VTTLPRAINAPGFCWIARSDANYLQLRCPKGKEKK
jgi:hypothetical protein